MDQNPYQAPPPPLADDGDRRPSPTPAATRPQWPRDGMSLPPNGGLVEEVFAQSYHVFRVRMQSCVFAYWSSVVVLVGARKSVAALLDGVSAVRPGTLPAIAFPLISVCSLLIVIFWLQCGLNQFLLRTARGERPSFSLIVRGGRHVLPTIIAAFFLLAGIAVVFITLALPVAIAWLVSQERQTAVRAGWICGVPAAVIILWLVVTFSQFSFATVDADDGPLSSLVSSYRLTAGYKPGLLVLLVVAAGVPASISAGSFALVRWLSPKTELLPCWLIVSISSPCLFVCPPFPWERQSPTCY